MRWPSTNAQREQVGHTYPAEDAHALAEIVQRLSGQPALVHEMGACARAFTEQAGDSRVVYRQMVEFLEQMV